MNFKNVSGALKKLGKADRKSVGLDTSWSYLKTKPKVVELMGTESRAAAVRLSETGSCWSRSTIIRYERSEFHMATTANKAVSDAWTLLRE